MIILIKYENKNDEKNCFISCNQPTKGRDVNFQLDERMSDLNECLSVIGIDGSY